MRGTKGRKGDKGDERDEKTKETKETNSFLSFVTFVFFVSFRLPPFSPLILQLLLCPALVVRCFGVGREFIHSSHKGGRFGGGI